jgi:hypothetical protein
MTTPTVRRLLAAAGALVVALPSAGCGRSDAPGTGPGTSRPTVASTATPTLVTTATPTVAPTVATSVASTVGASTSTTEPVEVIDGAGLTFGPADDGATIRLRVGDTARLLLPLGDQAPSATGAAVQLIEFVSVDAPVQREFEVRAVAAGRAEVLCAEPRLRLVFMVKA